MMKQKWGLTNITMGISMVDQDETRFRSFAERYVIERTSTFPIGEEDKHGWEAIQRAKTAYKQIAMVAQATYGKDPGEQQAIQQAAHNSPGNPIMSALGPGPKHGWWK